MTAWTTLLLQHGERLKVKNSSHNSMKTFVSFRSFSTFSLTNVILKHSTHNEMAKRRRRAIKRQRKNFHVSFHIRQLCPNKKRRHISVRAINVEPISSVKRLMAFSATATSTERTKGFLFCVFVYTAFALSTFGLRQSLLNWQMENLNFIGKSHVKGSTFKTSFKLEIFTVTRLTSTAKLWPLWKC